MKDCLGWEMHSMGHFTFRDREFEGRSKLFIHRYLQNSKRPDLADETLARSARASLQRKNMP